MHDIVISLILKVKKKEKIEKKRENGLPYIIVKMNVNNNTNHS